MRYASAREKNELKGEKARAKRNRRDSVTVVFGILATIWLDVQQKDIWEKMPLCGKKVCWQ